MKVDDIGNQPCSIARTLSIIGDRWTAMIIRNAFLGIRRFEDFQRNLGITRHVLAARLKFLVEQNVLTKVPYSDSQKRFEYCLTAQGLDLYPILMSMMKWGDRWLDQNLGAPVEYIHQSCGHKFTPIMTCSICHQALHVHDIKPIAGPGLYAYFAQKKQGIA